MITEYEKAKIKEVRDSLLASALQFEGEDLPEDIKVDYVGAGMATIDALFAIREGEPWRGLIDPKEIARAVLRQGHIGE